MFPMEPHESDYSFFSLPEHSVKRMSRRREVPSAQITTRPDHVCAPQREEDKIYVTLVSVLYKFAPSSDGARAWWAVCGQQQNRNLVPCLIQHRTSRQKKLETSSWLEACASNWHVSFIFYMAKSVVTFPASTHPRTLSKDTVTVLAGWLAGGGPR